MPQGGEGTLDEKGGFENVLSRYSIDASPGICTFPIVEKICFKILLRRCVILSPWVIVLYGTVNMNTRFFSKKKSYEAVCYLITRGDSAIRYYSYQVLLNTKMTQLHNSMRVDEGRKG